MASELPKGSPSRLMPSLVATIISPVVLFYTGGCLLSFGYFQRMSPAMLTAFSPTELALSGFARITNSIAILSVLALLLTLLASIAARYASTFPAKSSWDRLLGVLCMLSAGMMVFGLFSMGLYASLLGIVGIVLTAMIGGALLLGWEERLRRNAKPYLTLFIPVVSSIGLMALGEGSFILAINRGTAQAISVPTAAGEREALLMALGANAMVYHLDDCFYLSGPRAENPLKVNCRPLKAPFHSEAHRADARKRAPGSISACAPTKPPVGSWRLTP